MKYAPLAAVAICVVVVAGSMLLPQGQAQVPTSAMPPAGPPTVVNIHHHYYSAGPNASLVTGFAPSTAWHYGFQEASAAYVQPWKQNWGHLGFTGYLGQHGGGVDVTPDSANVFVGLVVDTVIPGSRAQRLGLVPGDFIVKINGVAADSYAQVATLFDDTEANPKNPLELEVWNPYTRRTQTLTVKP
jgi:membrane-associated protease RseP (regulator of RpoE activity)